MAMSRALTVAVLLAVLGIAVQAGQPGKNNGKAGPPPPYYIDETTLPFTPLAGATASWGVHKGASYRIEMPDAWNGGLVLFNHGLRGDCVEAGDPACSLAPGGPGQQLRDVFVPRGFAWAASSYSTAGRDISQAARDTKDLGELFAATFGQPNRTYVVGSSLGGGVTTLMVEQWPNRFDGALPMCGVMNYPLELDTISLGYPMVAAALAGQEGDVAFPMPAGTDFLTDVVPDITTALGLADQLPLPLTASGQTFRAAIQMLSGGPRAVKSGDPRNLFDLSFWFWFRDSGLFGFFRDVRHYDLTPGNISGNADAVYQLDTDPALSAAEIDLNARVPRDAYDINSRHLNGMAGLPSTDGDLRVPMLSLFDIGDLFVPFVLQQDYARKVAANGKSHLLVQRGIREYQHCRFTNPELSEAFDALVSWVETGVKPAGDDVLNPATVAHETFGCQFTRVPQNHGLGLPFVPNNSVARPLPCQ